MYVRVTIERRRGRSVRYATPDRTYAQGGELEKKCEEIRVENTKIASMLQQ